MLCSEITLIKNEHDTITIEPLPCNRWSCDHCQPQRKKRLIAQAMCGTPTTFLTLTCNPTKERDPVSAAKHLVRCWREVRRAACRKYGYKSIPFFAVFEATKKGWPHLHILARVKWLDQRWLSLTMKRLNGAPIVDVRRVHSAKEIANYVGKYVGKAPQQFGTCKRYWSSMDWEQLTKEEKDSLRRNNGSYRCVRYSAQVIADDYRAFGWNVVATSTGFACSKGETCKGYDPWSLKQE